MSFLIGISLAQALAFTIAPMIMLLGGILGISLQENENYSTLPVASMIVGMAAGVLPVSHMMVRKGRQFAFSVALFTGAVAALISSFAVYIESFLLVCVCFLMLGGTLAAVAQFRFAALAACAPSQHSVIASRLLLASLISAVIGPELVSMAQYFEGLGYSFPLLVLSGLLLCAFGVIRQLIFIDEPLSENSSQTSVGFPRGFSLAVLSSATAYAVMSLIMTAAPISIINNNYDVSVAKWAIQIHIICMFLPSLLSGHIIKRLGEHLAMLVGTALLFLSIIIGLSDSTKVHYIGCLILLGLGWNILFISGTSYLMNITEAFKLIRVKLQGYNDMLMMFAQGVASLSSGAVLLNYGWTFLLLVAVGFLLVFVVVLLFSWIGRSKANHV